MHKIRYAVVTISLFIAVTFFCSCTNPSDKTNSASTLEMESGSTSFVPQNGNAENIKVGDTAPDFTLKDLKGSSLRLSSLRGKKILLNVWWLECKRCKDEMPLLQEIHRKWSPKGLVVLAVSAYDSDNVIRAYAQNNKLTFTMLVDPDKKLDRSYSISGFPITIFIDGEGVVKAIQNGDFVSIEEIESMLKSL
jgi:peroxiredoxin